MAWGFRVRKAAKSLVFGASRSKGSGLIGFRSCLVSGLRLKGFRV